MYKLIIADDEAKIRQGLSRYFPWNSIGFEVSAEAKNGRQVIQYLENNSADVILCDIKMPNVSGIELAEYIFVNRLNTMVVFISAYRDFEFAQSAIQFGVRNYILKPTDYEELKDIFSKLKLELDEANMVSNIDTKKNDAAVPYSYHDKIISIVKEYVNNSYKDVTLNEVAEYVHLNPYYLSKLFKKKTNQNFSDYLLTVKMKKAAELLKDIKHKCYDVGSYIGYKNPKNFSRAFKNFYGVSPKDYRSNFNCLKDGDEIASRINGK